MNTIISNNEYENSTKTLNNLINEQMLHVLIIVELNRNSMIEQHRKEDFYQTKYKWIIIIITISGILIKEGSSFTCSSNCVNIFDSLVHFTAAACNGVNE